MLKSFVHSAILLPARFFRMDQWDCPKETWNLVYAEMGEIKAVDLSSVFNDTKDS